CERAWGFLPGVVSFWASPMTLARLGNTDGSNDHVAPTASADRGGGGRRQALTRGPERAGPGSGIGIGTGAGPGMARILGGGAPHGLNPIPASGYNIRVIPELWRKRLHRCCGHATASRETGCFASPDMAFIPNF